MSQVMWILTQRQRVRRQEDLITNGGKKLVTNAIILFLFLARWRCQKKKQRDKNEKELNSGSVWSFIEKKLGEHMARTTISSESLVKLDTSPVNLILAPPYHICARRGGLRLMVSALVPGSSGPGSSPGRGHSVVFLGKTLYSHSASLYPGL